MAVTLLVALLVGPCHAQGRIDCNALESRILGQRVHYCVMLPPDYDTATAGHSPRRYPVLYFLHGLGDNEQTLFKSGGWDVIEDLRQQGQISDFLVVAPEGRRSFYINSADGRVRYSDFFIREFIPYIESHYSIRRERSARAISGVSMGGYGALRFAFAYPELFSSVSAQSAALITESPQQAETWSCSGAVFGNPIDVPHWNQNSPFVLAKQNRARIRARVCPSISTAAVRMTSDLIKELRSSIGNFRRRASNTNFISIPATTARSIFWHTSVKC